MRGKYCIIGVAEIGPGTVIKNYVEIRDSTTIGKDCYIDSRVNISGQVKIGDNVTLRYGVILARGCEVGDNTYIAPRVMTNNLDNDLQAVGGAKIGANCFIGTHVILNHGITICDSVTIGAGTLVLKDITEPGIYVNSYKKGRLKLINLKKKDPEKLFYCFDSGSIGSRCSTQCETCSIYFQSITAS